MRLCSTCGNYSQSGPGASVFFVAIGQLDMKPAEAIEMVTTSIGIGTLWYNTVILYINPTWHGSMFKMNQNDSLRKAHW